MYAKIRVYHVQTEQKAVHITNWQTYGKVLIEEFLVGFKVGIKKLHFDKSMASVVRFFLLRAVSIKSSPYLFSFLFDDSFLFY